MKSQIHVVIFAMFWLIVPKIVHSSTKCNTKLIQSFHLKGLKYSVSEKMTVCPNVFESCCGPLDEISIIKDWNENVSIRLRIYNQKLFLGIQSVAEYAQILRKFTQSDIIVNFIEYRWMRYLHRNVESNVLRNRRNRNRINAQFNVFIPGFGAVRHFVPNPEDISFIVRVAGDARVRSAIMLYFAALARTIATDFPRFETFVEIFSSESQIGPEEFLSTTRESRMLLLRNLKKIMAKDMIKKKRFAEKAFQKVVKGFSQNSEVQPLLPEFEEKFQKRFMNILDEVKGFLNELKVEDDSKDYINKIKSSKKTITRDFEKIERSLQESKKQFKHPNLNLQNQGERKLINNEDDIEKSNSLSDKNTDSGMESSFNPERNLKSDEQKSENKPFLENIENAMNSGLEQSSNEKAEKLPERMLSEKNLRKMKHIKTKSNLKKITKKAVRKSKQVKLNVKKTTKKEVRKSKVTKKARRQKRKLIKQSKKPKFATRHSKIRSLKSLDRFKMIPVPRKLRRSAQFRVWMNQVRPRFIRLFNQLIQFSLNLPRVSESMVSPPRVQLPGSANHMILRTRTNRRVFMRGLVVTNIPKLQYCFKIQDNFLAFNHPRLLEEITNYFAVNQEVMGLKKTLYCSICNAHTHRNFVKKANLIIYEERFCMDLLATYSSFIFWRHIKLIEYFDLVYQYMSCLESDGTVVHFPFRSFLDRSKRRMDFVRRCLESAKDEDAKFMAACHFMCVQFRIQGISKFWDGDFKIVQQMLYLLFNSIRAQNWITGDQLEAFKMLLENNLVLDDENGGHERIINWTPPEDESTEDDERENPGTPPTRRLLKKPLSKMLFDKKSAEYKNQIDEIEEQLNKLEKNTDRGSANKHAPISREEERANLSLIMKKVDGMKYKLSELTRDAIFDPLTGERPDLKTKPKKINLKKTLKKSKKVKKTRKLASKNPIPDKKMKKRRSSRPNEEDLIRQIKEKGKIKRNIGRKLQDIDPRLPKNIHPHKRLVPEAVFSIGEVYEKRRILYNVDCFRAFYTDMSGAINPVRINGVLDFHNTNLTMLLTNKYTKSKTDDLNLLALKIYFDTDFSFVEKFNADVYMMVMEKFGKRKEMKYIYDFQDLPPEIDSEVLNETIYSNDENYEKSHKTAEVENDELTAEERSRIVDPLKEGDNKEEILNSENVDLELVHVLIHKKE